MYSTKIKPKYNPNPNPRIGLIALASDFTIEKDFINVIKDKDIDFFVNRIECYNPLTSENLIKMSQKVTEVTKDILPDQKIDCIVYGCTSGTIAIGKDKIEKKIEALIDKKISNNLSSPEKLGRVKRLETGTKKYITILKKNFTKEFNLRGLRIVIDCANGAGYKAGPELLKSLGAKVIPIGIKPNGLNINKKCGSTFPRKIRSAVKKYKAHIGISLDGDADRIIMCDEKSNIIDGDQIIAALATRWKNKKMLKGGVVGTLMSNYGLEKYFKSKGIKFLRANVGDRYVKEKMQKYNFNLGGEQSGHIILGKFATTGDGLLVALEALFALRKGKKASEFFDQFKKTPQLLENIEVKDKNIINKPEIKKIIKNADKLIKGNGRILVRKSGTESKIRVMGESENTALLYKCVNMITKKIK